jgi:hypothetical protein
LSLNQSTYPSFLNLHLSQPSLNDLYITFTSNCLEKQRAFKVVLRRCRDTLYETVLEILYFLTTHVIAHFIFRIFGKLTLMLVQQKGTQWGPANNHPKQSQAPRIEKKPTLAMSRPSIDPASFEDASDSDVSTYNPDPRNPGVDPKVYLTNPVQPPPANPETKEAIEARIAELENIEKENTYRYDLLCSKRQRKDDKIRQRRAMEDHRIQTARANKDERVRFRRAPQDNAFAQVDRAIDAEEFALRHKLKRMKKGRPLDEPDVVGRTYSSASMSPPVPSNYQSPIPPAKRHQPGPPGQMAPQRPPQNGQAPYPPYQFYQPSEPPRPGSRGYGPPPHVQNYPPYSPTNGPPSAANEKPPSGTPQQSHMPAQNTTTTQLAQRSGPAHASPPHNADSNYNILPPPPSSSSFAPINPPTSGFAPINPQVLSSSSTPVQANVKPMPGSLKASQPPLHGLDNAFHHSPTNPPGRVPTPGSTAVIGKRTPSTTHPYTQSEAFNNRHHKCERVDALNRGIWTSYGPGGTVDNPAGPKVEMYLRCSHENCMRIDWRTVHGLQCHIVKNHEQPKGTIGSLEKALDRYGVPVSEIEEYERLHGPGSGGTMADPKNTKPKSRATPRTSEIMPSVVTLGNAQVQLPSESPTPPPATSGPNNLLFPRISQRTQSGGFIQNDIVYSDEEEEEKVDVKEGEKGEVKMQDAPTSISEGDANVQDDAAKAKELEPSAPTGAEVPPPLEQKTQEAGPSEDTETTSPPVANKEAPTTSVASEPVAAETSQDISNPQPAFVQEPSRSTSPAQNVEKDKEPQPAYNQAQRELQGNNDSGDSDNEDSIVVKDRLRSPPKRTRAGRFVKKTSISKSPAYRYTRKGSDF